jgi:hypothetical protein
VPSFHLVDRNNASPIEEQPIDTRGFNVDRNRMNPEFKSELVQKRWEALYDFDGAMRLKEAMKRHLYKKKIWRRGIS